MMWLMLWACSGGSDTADSGDVEEVCESVAVASYEVVHSQLTGEEETPAVMLDPTGSTLCEGDQVVWWAEYDGWFIVGPSSWAEVPEGLTLLDLGISFNADVILNIVPEGEDPETWNPCEFPSDIFSLSCESPSVIWLFVDAPYDYFTD